MTPFEGPDHPHYRKVILGFGIAAILLIVGFRNEELIKRLDALSSVITGVATVSGLIIVALRAEEQRKEQRLAAQRDAWQTLVAANGKPGSFGRRQAIEALALDGVVMDGVNLSGAYLEGLSVPPKTRFHRAIFDSIGNTSCVLSKAKLDGVIASDARFWSAEMYDTSCNGAILSRAQFDHAKLVNGSFASANLIESRLESTDCTNASFVGANLHGGKMAVANFTHANFSGADLRFTRIADCQMAFADVSGTDLRSAEISRCDFRGIKWDTEMTVAGAIFDCCSNLPLVFADWLVANGAVVKC